jgi:hypothetical protein
MTNRILVAGLAAALGVGSMLLPDAAFARGGGFGGGRAIGFHGGFHPFLARPFVPFRPVVFPRIAPRIHVARLTPFRHPHRFFGPGLPAAGVGVSYGWGWGGYGYGNQIQYVPVNEPAQSTSPDVATPGGNQVSRVVCNSETIKVPAEGGGERAITVTRC